MQKNSLNDVAELPRSRGTGQLWSDLAHRAATGTLAFPRSTKRMIVVAVDTCLCALTAYTAFYLRLGEWIALKGNQWLALIIAILLVIPIFAVSGLYRTIFRFSSGATLISLAQACLVYGVAYATIVTFIQIDNVPRTIGLIQPVLLFVFLAASRVIGGWWLSGNYTRLIDSHRPHPLMIYGAGTAGRQLCQALADSEMNVRGFIDDDPSLHGRVLLGKPIFAPDDIEGLVRRGAMKELLLAIPSASRKRRSEIVALIGPLGVAVRTIPSLIDVAQGRVRIENMRHLDLDDLLGREPVVPDPALLIRNNRGKTVLVTGAGGSIGSELCRQVLAAEPSTLLLVEMSEPALYAIHQELERNSANYDRRPKIIALLASVCDADRINQILDAWRPDTIYHAAAYKHVPLVEHNPLVGIRNNVFGTLVMAQAACRHGVGDFVFISTDKAVRPTNVMGATKRLAEQVLQALAAGQPDTRLSMVRFGNVLGSSGSVVPLFRHQIAMGGPLTITHPDITRYFMSISEAAELVIQAGAMAEGGEVFVLDMGSPVKIAEMAKMMVELSGSTLRSEDRPDGDIEITYVGLRPGEKLYEELLISDNSSATAHPRIMKVSENFIPWSHLHHELEALRTLIDAGRVETLISTMLKLVPEYTPELGSVDWIHLKRCEYSADMPL